MSPSVFTSGAAGEAPDAELTGVLGSGTEMSMGSEAEEVSEGCSDWRSSAGGAMSSGAPGVTPGMLIDVSTADNKSVVLESMGVAPPEVEATGACESDGPSPPALVEA